MPRQLPGDPDLDSMEDQAEELREAHRAGEPEAIRRVREAHPTEPDGPAAGLSRDGARLVVARESGFTGWPELKAHADSRNSGSGDGAGELLEAIRTGDVGRVRRLLGRHAGLRARINEPIGTFDSPALNGARSPEMIDALIDAGADLDAKSRWWAGGFRILHSAGPDLAAHAIGRGATVDVHAAARLGLLERLGELIERHPRLVHARGGLGQTPLHFAGTVEVASDLLDRGADIDARDLDHESTPALHMLDHRPEVARFLVRRGCEVDILLASALGEIDRVRALLDADPGCLRVRANGRSFPMVDAKAGGTIHRWTLGPDAGTGQPAPGDDGRPDRRADPARRDRRPGETRGPAAGRGPRRPPLAQLPPQDAGAGPLRRDPAEGRPGRPQGVQGGGGVARRAKLDTAFIGGAIKEEGQRERVRPGRPVKVSRPGLRS